MNQNLIANVDARLYIMARSCPAAAAHTAARAGNFRGHIDVCVRGLSFWARRRRADGLGTLLVFTVLRLEFGWSTTPVTSNKIGNLTQSCTRNNHPSVAIDAAMRGLLDGRNQGQTQNDLHDRSATNEMES